MNINQFTQKSIESINGLEKLAHEYGNQQIEQIHLLYRLLTIDDSLIASLLEIDIKKASAAILLGLLLATVIMDIVSYGVLGSIL